jgi:hypothetical protein
MAGKDLLCRDENIVADLVVAALDIDRNQLTDVFVGLYLGTDTLVWGDDWYLCLRTRTSIGSVLAGGEERN